MDNIYIACAADRAFFRHIPMMLNSVMKNTSSHLVVGVFTQDIKEEEHMKLQNMLPDIEFKFWTLNHQIFSGFFFKKTLSPMSYARIIMADYTEWDKFIYLDLDIIVKQDISLLFNIDLSENYIASVPDNNSINAGVLLVNGKKWREEKIKDIGLKYASEMKPKEADQATIEFICNNKILYIDQKWNYTIDAIWGKKKLLSHNYKQAYIIHFITGFKPWNLGRIFLPGDLKTLYKSYVIKNKLPRVYKKEIIVLIYQIKVIIIDVLFKRLSEIVTTHK